MLGPYPVPHFLTLRPQCLDTVLHPASPSEGCLTPCLRSCPQSCCITPPVMHAPSVHRLVWGGAGADCSAMGPVAGSPSPRAHPMPRVRRLHRPTTCGSPKPVRSQRISCGASPAHRAAAQVIRASKWTPVLCNDPPPPPRYPQQHRPPHKGRASSPPEGTGSTSGASLIQASALAENSGSVQRHLRERWRGCGKIRKLGLKNSGKFLPNCPMFLQFFSHQIHAFFFNISQVYFLAISLNPPFSAIFPFYPFFHGPAVIRLVRWRLVRTPANQQDDSLVRTALWAGG